MIHPPRLTRERIEKLLAIRRSSAQPTLEKVVEDETHCLTESHFGDIDDYNDSLIKSHASDANKIRVVSLTPGDFSKLDNFEDGSERALCWKVLQLLNLTKKAGRIVSGTLPFGGLGVTEETPSNYNLEQYRKEMTQKKDMAIVPVLMNRIDDHARENVHAVAERLAGGPIRILCLWSRSLGPTSHSDEMEEVHFSSDASKPIDDAELTSFLTGIDKNFGDARQFDNSFGLIWSRLTALEQVLRLETVLQKEALLQKSVADLLSQRLFEFLQREDGRVRGQLSKMPNVDDLREVFYSKELPLVLSRADSKSLQRTLYCAVNLKLITSRESSKSTHTYDLNAALHAEFDCNSSVPNSPSATKYALTIKTSAVKPKEQNGSEASTTTELNLPEFRPGATAASRLKTLLLLNQGRRIPMWLVSHPTMGGTSAFRVIRDKYRDPGHVTFIDDPVSKLQAVQVHETLGAAAPSIGGNMLDVSTQLITLTRKTFAINNPLVEPEFAQSIEKDVLSGSPSFAIMKKVFLALPNIPVWEYWMIWLLSVRLKPETIDRDLRELVKPGHPNNLPGLLKIPHDKGAHECESHAEFDELWARSKKSKQLSNFVDEWANKIPRVEANHHTFTHGLDWYIYVPK